MEHCGTCHGPVALPGHLPCEARCACGRSVRLLEYPPRPVGGAPPEAWLPAQRR